MAVDKIWYHLSDNVRGFLGWKKSYGFRPSIHTRTWVVQGQKRPWLQFTLFSIFEKNGICKLETFLTQDARCNFISSREALQGTYLGWIRNIESLLTLLWLVSHCERIWRGVWWSYFCCLTLAFNCMYVLSAQNRICNQLKVLHNSLLHKLQIFCPRNSNLSTVYLWEKL